MAADQERVTCPLPGAAVRFVGVEGSGGGVALPTSALISPVPFGLPQPVAKSYLVVAE